MIFALLLSAIAAITKRYCDDKRYLAITKVAMDTFQESITVTLTAGNFHASTTVRTNVFTGMPKETWTSLAEYEIEALFSKLNNPAQRLADKQ